MAEKLSALHKMGLLTTDPHSDCVAVRKRFLELVKPADAFEEIFFEGFIQEQIEVERYRRAKRGMMELAIAEALEKIFEYARQNNFTSKPAPKALAAVWFKGEEERTKLKSIMEEWGLNEAIIEAKAIQLHAEDIAKVDVLLERAMKKRDGCIAILTDYRRDFGQALIGVVVEGKSNVLPLTRRPHLTKRPLTHGS